VNAQRAPEDHSAHAADDDSDGGLRRVQEQARHERLMQRHAAGVQRHRRRAPGDAHVARRDRHDARELERRHDEERRRERVMNAECGGGERCPGDLRPERGADPDHECGARGAQGRDERARTPAASSGEHPCDRERQRDRGRRQQRERGEPRAGADHGDGCQREPARRADDCERPGHREHAAGDHASEQPDSHCVARPRGHERVHERADREARARVAEREPRREQDAPAGGRAADGGGEATGGKEELDRVRLLQGCEHRPLLSRAGGSFPTANPDRYRLVTARRRGRRARPPREGAPRARP
jgi:hypothetical protein